MEILDSYKGLLAEIGKLDSAASLLSWDERTYIPPKAHEARAMVVGKLAKMSDVNCSKDILANLPTTIARASWALGGM